MSIVNGTDLDIDLDGDGVGDFDLGTIVSPKGILHFIFGGSGYLTLVGPDKWNFWGYLIAIGVGLLVAGVMFLVYWGMSKLADEKKQETGDDLVGRTGTIYLPTEIKGTYEITIERNGRPQQITVKSKSEKEYVTGEIVSIVSFELGVYYIE
jgi:membrane protein implicated in regulation of membrane protease activity